MNTQILRTNANFQKFTAPLTEITEQFQTKFKDFDTLKMIFSTIQEVVGSNNEIFYRDWNYATCKGICSYLVAMSMDINFSNYCLLINNYVLHLDPSISESTFPIMIRIKSRYRSALVDYSPSLLKFQSMYHNLLTKYRNNNVHIRYVLRLLWNKNNRLQ